MDKDDFTKFIAKHQDRYPGIARNFKERPGQMEVWKEMLGDFEFMELQEASLELSKQDDQPRGFADHPRALYAIVKRNQKRRQNTWVDGEKTVSCPSCKDDGTISCVNPYDTARVMRGVKTSIRPMAFACTCKRGERWKEHTHVICKEVEVSNKALVDRTDATLSMMVPVITWSDVMRVTRHGDKIAAVKQLIEEHEDF